MALRLPHDTATACPHQTTMTLPVLTVQSPFSKFQSVQVLSLPSLLFVCFGLVGFLVWFVLVGSDGDGTTGDSSSLFSCSLCWLEIFAPLVAPGLALGCLTARTKTTQQKGSSIKNRENGSRKVGVLFLRDIPIYVQVLF